MESSSTSGTSGNEIKRYCYCTWLKEKESVELEYHLMQYDLLRRNYLFHEFDPSVMPNQRLTENVLNWRIGIFNPNVGEEHGCTQVKSNEIGYLISFKSVTKKSYHDLVGRIQASFYNMDSEKKMLLCTDCFCTGAFSNYYDDNNEMYHFDFRKLPFDESLGVQKLLVSVTIQLYFYEIMDKGFEEHRYVNDTAKD